MEPTAHSSSSGSETAGGWLALAPSRLEQLLLRAGAYACGVVAALFLALSLSTFAVSKADAAASGLCAAILLLASLSFLRRLRRPLPSFAPTRSAARPLTWHYADASRLVLDGPRGPCTVWRDQVSADDFRRLRTELRWQLPPVADRAGPLSPADLVRSDSFFPSLRTYFIRTGQSIRDRFVADRGAKR